MLWVNIFLYSIQKVSLEINKNNNWRTNEQNIYIKFVFKLRKLTKALLTIEKESKAEVTNGLIFVILSRVKKKVYLPVDYRNLNYVYKVFRVCQFILISWNIKTLKRRLLNKTIAYNV